jgi:short-chain fatty acids transporter
MSFSGKFERLFHNVLPSPFALAVVLTFCVFGIALLFFKPSDSGVLDHVLGITGFWYDGLWSGPMLVFGYQMILILVLGHVLALSEPVDALIRQATVYCTSTPRAAAIVCALCVAMGLINWGLALIFGAVFARKVAEHARTKGIKINYPLVAAAGYTGLMVWHGGLSGSALIKVAEPGHLESLMAGIPAYHGQVLPEYIGFSDTVFAPMNLAVALALILVLPFSAYALGKWSAPTPFITMRRYDHKSPEPAIGVAERMDHSSAPVLILGFLLIFAVVGQAVSSLQLGNGQFVDPNFLNTLFLGLGILAHGNLSRFALAVEEAMVGAAGILIQFPLYFGILGIMKNSGMVTEISDFFVSISNIYTYPIFTFISAGFVNILVPSGGGQWMVQGPIIVEASQNLGVPLGKSILAMAYGDQITNMLQPFWALPLLAITGLRARDILPYTIFFMAIGMVIYLSALMIF